MCSNEKNLYDFYRLIGSGRFAMLVEGNDYYAVSGIGGNWPQMIFDIKPDQNAGLILNKAFSESAEKLSVRFAVCRKEFLKTIDQGLLRYKGILPVGNWQLMEINSIGSLKNKVPEEYNISRLSKPEDVDEYTILVNDSLMKNSQVGKELFRELIQHDSLEIFGMFKGKELISGLLAYTGLNKVAGLYFITTKPEYRGKGMASGIIEIAVKSLLGQGVDKVVLQAVPKAVNLYARMGFSHQGELVIFWKK